MWPLILLGVVVASIVWEQIVDHDRRKIDRRPLTEVSETAIAAIKKDGARVRIKGRAVAREPLRTSPISFQDCIGFRLTVEWYNGGDENEWTKVVEQDDLTTVVIADETGEAVLHAPFELRLPSTGGQGTDLPRAVVEALANADVARDDFFGMPKAFRYVETVLLPGDEIIAVGFASFEIDPAVRSASHREPPVRCHLKGSEEAVILANVEQAWTGST